LLSKRIKQVNYTKTTGKMLTIHTHRVCWNYDDLADYELARNGVSNMDSVQVINHGEVNKNRYTAYRTYYLNEIYALIL
jgi:hypothetical protein